MAMFIGIIEKAGEFENDNGEKVAFHNFVVSYADEKRPEDIGRYEVDSSKHRVFEHKVKAEDALKFFGFEVFHPSQFDDSCGKPVDLIFGRNGLSGMRFKEVPEDPALKKKA